MKKNFLMFILSFVFGASILLTGCNFNFVNPGDLLGGGGVGETPTEIDTNTIETEIETTASVDLSSLSTDTDSSSVESTNIYTGSSTTLEITSAGDYILSGEYSSGIVINVGNNETTHIFLNNATITNNSGIAIENKNKKSTVILTVIGSNSITNSGDDVNAIHVKGTLNINGSGTLNITSNSKSGIKVSKVLSIVDTNVNIVSAQNHGITARTIIAEDCNINIDYCTKDGLQAECDEETQAFTTEEGYVSLKNVNYSCSSLGDGIQADTFVCIDGGVYNIETTATFVAKTSANMSEYGLVSDDFKYVASGTGYKRIASDSTTSATRYAMIQSTKGIKAGEIEYEDEDGNEISVTDGDYYVIIKSGTLNINSDDDAIHSNYGNITINDGTFTINTLDDGVTADNLLTINGGSFDIQSCYEGMEGAYVEITNGTINIVSEDDGINAASDDTSISEHIIISGGNITVNASGDGIDSNGSILIEGDDTKVIVHGPTNGADAGLYADKGIVINGGYVFASSTLGMVETPSTNSEQYILSFAQSSSISKGTNITITDSSGEAIFTVATEKLASR